ncbi:MAG TPA: response regulator transcription factor [Fimbriimonadaceae bacterium]|nr:response regulator transcription factor [Fimbriimonadaceae bacterium]
MNDLTKVVVAEDDSLLRRALVELLSLDGGFEVLSDVPNGQMLLEHVGVVRPHVVLTDIEMPKLNGIEATKAIVSTFPEIAVVILTKFGDDDNLFNAMRAGASGYVLKDAPIEEIKQAIREAREGEAHLNPALVSRVLGEFQRIANAASERKALFAELTRREIEVLELIGKGMRNRAIAESLFLSEKTVKTHVGGILRKLQLNDRTEAALYAKEHGL